MFARRVSANGSTPTLEKGNLRLRTSLNDLEQILAKIEHSASSSRCSYDRKRISLYLPRENSCPLCLSPRADEQKDYEKSTRSTAHEVSTSTPGRVGISPQEHRMSEEKQTDFIESRLVSFKEGILSALLLQRLRKMKYSRQIETTRENADKSAVNSQLARLEVLLYIQSVTSIYL